MQGSDELYYSVDLISLARADADTGGENPEERAAADAFNQVIDSVQLLDRSAIYQDQADRLIRTRGLLANWTPAFLSLRLNGQGYYRLVRDGQDIGYVYDVEAYDDGAGRIGGVPVVRILQRSDSQPTPGTVVDAQSRLVCTVDLKHEDWVNTVIFSVSTPDAPAAVFNGQPQDKKAPTLTEVSEIGVSDQRSKAVPICALGGDILGPVNTNEPTIQPGLRMSETWMLSVMRSTADALHPSIKHDLPAFRATEPSGVLRAAGDQPSAAAIVHRSFASHLFVRRLRAGRGRWQSGGDAAIHGRAAGHGGEFGGAPLHGGARDRSSWLGRDGHYALPESRRRFVSRLIHQGI